MPSLVDTNVILDIITDDPAWAEWSANALESAGEELLFVNTVIFSELCVGAENVDEVVEILSELRLEMHDLSLNALFLAAKAFKRYRANQGNKTSPLPDFYIGAQAEDYEWTLITRDPSRYQTYYPKVRLVSP